MVIIIEVDYIGNPNKIQNFVSVGVVGWSKAEMIISMDIIRIDLVSTIQMKQK